MKGGRKSLCLLLVLHPLLSFCQIHWFPPFPLISSCILGFIINTGPSIAVELFYTCFVCCFLSLTLVTFCRPSSLAPITWHLLSPSHIFVEKLMNESCKILNTNNAFLPSWVLFPLLGKNFFSFFTWLNSIHPSVFSINVTSTEGLLWSHNLNQVFKNTLSLCPIICVIIHLFCDYLLNIWLF